MAGSIARIAEATGRSAEDARLGLARANPQGRFVTPDEVAGCVLFLCGRHSAAINGQSLAVAGGEVMP
ncbi:MAG TPA: SDR family oxidoreductase [Acetobacteraceae bacterium]